jgi:glycosyltransferase involved in cell wall biosynthesis
LVEAIIESTARSCVGDRPRIARAILLEPFASGHRASYVRWIAESLLRSDVSVRLAAPRPVLDHPAIAALASAEVARGRLELLEVDAPKTAGAEGGVLALWRSERQMHAWFASVHRRASPAVNDGDLVIVPYLDYCFHSVAINGSPFRNAPWCAITMRTEFPRSGGDLSGRAWLRIKLLQRMLALPGLRAVFSIDPSVEGFVAGHAKDSRWRGLHYLPDPGEPVPLEPRALARRTLGLDEEQRVVLLFGSIDPRKGLAELLRGAAVLPDSARWTLLIAGQQTPTARALIRSWQSMHEVQPRLWVHDAFVEPSLAGTLFGACDVVWLGYPDHRSMSGVLVQAGLASKSVVAHEGTLIAMLAQRAGIGTICDVRSPQAVARSLVDAAHPDKLAAARHAGPAAFDSHRISSVGRAFVDLLLDRARVGELHPVSIDSQCVQ